MRVSFFNEGAASSALVTFWFIEVILTKKPVFCYQTPPQQLEMSSQCHVLLLLKCWNWFILLVCRPSPSESPGVPDEHGDKRAHLRRDHPGGHERLLLHPLPHPPQRQEPPCQQPVRRPQPSLQLRRLNAPQTPPSLPLPPLLKWQVAERGREC